MSRPINPHEGRWAWIFVVLPYVLFGLLVPPVGETPYSDDFDYAATAFHLAETGRLILSDWPTTTLAGHAAWGAFFCEVGGSSYLMLRLSMFVLSALAALSLYAWSCRLGHSTSFAVWCGVSFAVSPVAVSLEYTFLTDMTGAALATFLVLLSRGLPGAKYGYYWFGYGLLGGVAYLSRQTACIPFLFVCAATAWQCFHKKARMSQLVLLAAPFATLVLGYRFWLAEMHGVPSHHRFQFMRPGSLAELGERLVTLVTGLGLQLAPFAMLLVMVGTAARWNGLWRQAVVAMISILAVSWLTNGDWPMLFRGELFDLGLRAIEMPASDIPEMLKGPRWHWGDRDVSLFRVSTVAVSVFSAAILLVFGIRNRRAGRPWRGAPPWAPSIARLSLMATAGLLMLTWVYVDRYQLGLLPLALLTLAEMLPPELSQNRRAMACAWATTMLMGTFSLFGIQDGMQRTQTFWSTARQLHALDVSPQSIDAGLAYGGFYRYSPTYRGENNVGPYLDSLPPQERELVVATFSPLTLTANRPVRISFDEAEGYRVAARRPFRSWFRTGEVLVLVRQNVPDTDLPPRFVEWLNAARGGTP